MRLSEFSGKEIIDIDYGEKRGVIAQSDMEINPLSGEITSIFISGGSFLGFGRKKEDLVIPWSSIIQIGPDMIIVQLKPDSDLGRGLPDPNEREKVNYSIGTGSGFTKN
ncbi:YlmC/YmxH family sporulation protein [Brevibacillus daliensis]|uniref:YlmC/YmxH family sporulation protein n=1 Tax=Brevibacillus daliensis TaxID=2892995 RepID=UPI001E54BA9C|nr:YlmC/YmxH family sporulation protein [Brevibacillus daliensis]